MLFRNKKGENMASKAIAVLLIGFLAIVGIITLIDVTSTETSFVDSLINSFDEASKLFMNILGPLLKGVLDLGGDKNDFLKILSFILVSIVVVGTLDSVNIFGENKEGNLINLIIGIIVSIIGVRYMPNDIWASLTAPSSAFVATLLAGAPFAALFFVTMKIKYPLARKLLWLFYFVFMSYLIFFPEGGANSFTWIYAIFLVLAGVMMYFDSTVRKYIREEIVMTNLAKGLSVDAIKRRAEIQTEIKGYIASKRETRNKAERKQIDDEIARLKEEYKELGRVGET
jgi:hypothetical protein